MTFEQKPATGRGFQAEGTEEKSLELDKQFSDLSYVLSEPVLDGFVTILIGMYSAVSSENVICLGASNTLI